MGRGTAILAKMDLKITFEKKGWNYEVQVCLTLTKNVEKFEKKFPQLLFQIFFCTSCMSKSTIDVSGFAAGTHISSIAISLYIFNLSMYVNTGYSKWIGTHFKKIMLLCFLVSGISTRKGEIKAPEAKATVAL